LGDILEWIVSRSARPDWALLAIPYVFAGIIVWVIRSVSGICE
jgi:hypothetical protein